MQRKKIKLTLSWSCLSLLHALAVLGELPKLKRGMGLAFSADFLHTFSIKIYLIKFPVK